MRGNEASRRPRQPGSGSQPRLLSAVLFISMTRGCLVRTRPRRILISRTGWAQPHVWCLEAQFCLGNDFFEVIKQKSKSAKEYICTWPYGVGECFLSHYLINYHIIFRSLCCFSEDKIQVVEVLPPSSSFSPCCVTGLPLPRDGTCSLNTQATG